MYHILSLSLSPHPPGFLSKIVSWGREAFSSKSLSKVGALNKEGLYYRYNLIHLLLSLLATLRAHNPSLLCSFIHMHEITAPLNISCYSLGHGSPVMSSCHRLLLDHQSLQPLITQEHMEAFSFYQLTDRSSTK